MEKHLLLTVTDDARSIFEAEFIGSFFKHKEQIRVTLFSVVPKSQDEGNDVSRGAQDSNTPVAHHHRDKWQNAIQLKRELLLHLGFLDDHITSKVVRSSNGIIQDIILEGKKGHYDAVFLARHATELLGQTFSTSVTGEILNHKIDFPVWVCRHPEIGRRNVLLCVDDDEASMRIAEHVGFVLQQEAEHNITLFHVDAGLKRSNAHGILDRARQVLTDHGISDARIRSLLIQSHKVAKSIREEAERGAYAVIAIGHERAEPTGPKDWLVDSRCMTALGMLNQCVLWVSR